MTIKNTDGKVMTEAGTIMQYFGRQEGQTLSAFMTEVHQLSDKSKEELAVGAAKELGWTVEA